MSANPILSKGFSGSPEEVLAQLAAMTGAGEGQSSGETTSTPASTTPAVAWPSGPAAPRTQAVAKVNYTHTAMIDLILANPGISQNALGSHFGLTPSWVSQVLSSDAFQSAMAARREQIVDPMLIATVEENFKALVVRSQDILLQKLNKSPDLVPDNLALRTFEIASRAAGYGVKDAQPAQPPGGDIHVHLEALGGGLVALLQRKKLESKTLSLEGDFTDVTPTE